MPPVRQGINYSDFLDIEEFLQCPDTWQQQEMGELGSLSGNMPDMYNVYPGNCTGVTPGITDDPTCRLVQDEGRNYHILTPQIYTQVTASSQPEYISQTCVKQEFATRPYSYNYQTSPNSNSYATNLEMEGPYIRITEEPFGRHRFRYQSERGSHGGMNGQNTKDSKKTYPTIELVNFREDPNSVRIRASLWTSDESMPHVHKLQGKTCRPQGDCEQSLNRNFGCSFQGVSIIFTAKKEVVNILRQRKIDELEGQVNPELEKQFQMEAESEYKKLDMNTVRVRFDAIVFKDGNEQLIASEFSKPIHNQRELKIIRFSKCSGSCNGEDEVYLLCEKVNKKEIKIRFFECDADGNRVWENLASFSPESDVHHQVAIVFKTPKYRCEIQAPVKVHFELYREKDGETSEPRDFIYKPIKMDPEGISRKRARREDFGGEEFGRGPPNNFFDPGNYQDRTGNSQGQMYFDTAQGGDSNYGGTFYANGSPSTTSTFSPGSSSSTLQSQSPSSQFSSPISPNLLSPSASSTQSPNPTSVLNPAPLTLRRPSFSYTSTLSDIMDPSISPSDMCSSLTFEELYQNLDAPDLHKPDGAMAVAEMHAISEHRVKKESREQFDIISGLRNMRLDGEVDKKELLTVPSVRQRSSSLVEDRDLRTVAESNALRICLNRLAQSLRTYAITGDPRALIMPLRNLMAKADQNGDNPLHLAIIHHSSNEALLQNFISVVSREFLNQTNNLFQTPLHLAVLLNKPSIVQLLLMKGADPEVQDNEGNTAAHLAVKKKHRECLLVLLNKQIYRDRRVPLNFVDILNFDGLAAIHLAVKNEDADSLCKLADADAQINIGDGTSGRTPLHFAVEQHPNMIPWLLRQMKIDVDCQDFAGDTPLHLASICGDEEVVLQLMQADANPLIGNSLEREGVSGSEIPRGVTPFDIAKNETIQSILSGFVPDEIRRKLSNSRKTSLQDSDQTSFTNRDLRNDYDTTSSTSLLKSNSKQYDILTQHDSGYNSAPQINEISQDCLEKLCALLDPPRKEWKPLVEIYLGEKSDAFLKLHPESPTRGIIDIMKKHENFNKEVLKNALESAGLLNAEIEALFD